jgi:hypothetical protein
MEKSIYDEIFNKRKELRSKFNSLKENIKIEYLNNLLVLCKDYNIECTEPKDTIKCIREHLVVIKPIKPPKEKKIKIKKEKKEKKSKVITDLSSDSDSSITSCSTI